MARYPLRDLALLLLAALAARALAAWLVPSAPYTDAAYYPLVAERLADGFGFTIPVLWTPSSRSAAHCRPIRVLPVASNGHWMPLTSVVAAGGMAVFGASDWRAGQVPMVLLSVAWVGIVHGVTWDLWRNRGWALVARRARHLRGPAADHAAAGRLLRLVRRARRRSRSGHPRAPCASERWGWWLVLAGALVGLATLARVDGLILAVAPASRGHADARTCGPRWRSGSASPPPLPAWP